MLKYSKKTATYSMESGDHSGDQEVINKIKGKRKVDDNDDDKAQID